ncbi:MAG: family 10 glycosylhydrolase [Candidatus Sumerlaeaceae bacterium]|nr:family 10 glycosylhydrolase [Candidatus Sumerlaeaceae bacterium]
MAHRWLTGLCAGFLLAAAAATAETIIIDNRDAKTSATGTWSTGTSSGYYVTNYRYAITALTEDATFTFQPVFASSGIYDLYTWYVQGANRPPDARYIINHSGGTSVVTIDQTTSGAQWVPLGTFAMPATGGFVRISNQSSIAGRAVMADAVKFVRQGTTYSDNLYQAMWVDAWGTGFLSAAQTDAMINTARQNNLNAIFVQMRKTGDAYYQSATEPFASNITPGYTDPLADIIAKAHDTSGGKQYIEVHAWIVPYRIWTDSQGTPPSNHVWQEQPSWRGQTNTGSTSDGSWYLDPGVPAVTDYLVGVVSEIVQNYDVDGIHWDYFRYPGTSWGYNPIAVARFNALYGKTGQPATNDPDFCDFRRDQIRMMGRKVYAAIKAIRWNVKVSAATIQWGGISGGNFAATSAYNSIFQDWPGFMSEGLLDMNSLMNYKDEDNPTHAADYRDWAQFLADSRAGRIAINGPGAYMNTIYNTLTQTLFALDIPGITGTNFYSYRSTNDSGDSSAAFWETMKRDVYTKRRNVPEMAWITTPTQGILRATVTYGGVPIDGATVTLGNGASGTLKTDGTGFVAFLKLNPGTGYTATVTAPGHNPRVYPFDITAGAVTTLTFEVPVTVSRFEAQ